MAWTTDVRDLRFLVNFPAYSVTDQVSDDRVALPFHSSDHGGTDVTHMVPRLSGFDRDPESFLSDLEQPVYCIVHLTD
jgi:hypothetical protein